MKERTRKKYGDARVHVRDCGACKILFDTRTNNRYTLTQTKKEELTSQQMVERAFNRMKQNRQYIQLDGINDHIPQCRIRHAG